MDRYIYASVAKGVRYQRPKCYRCGDCCTYIPVEIRKEEAELIAKRLRGKKRKIFLESITTDWETANVLPFQNEPPLTFGIGWLISPCMFLKIKKKKGRERGHCEIYHIRPAICKTFWCGKDSRTERLDSNKYTYRTTESTARKLRGENPPA